MKFLNELKNDLNGLSTLVDWLGQGMQPVPNEEAEVRAAVCAPCIKNEHGDWWESAKTAVADAIRSQIALKKKLNVSTSMDHRIGTCSVCSCNLKLLAHVPIEILKEREPTERISAYPATCWKRQQLEST